MSKISSLTLNDERLASLNSEIDEQTRTQVKHKSIHQIQKTIKFEARRNLKKMIWLIILNTLMIILFVVINILQDSDPAESTDYSESFLSMISLIVLIEAITLGANIIVEDFEKQTGNLLFPKTEKGRLLIGRYIVRFMYGAIALVVFYIEIALLTYVKYSEVSNLLWGSMGWAIFYYYLILSFVTLMSSLLNRIATATIVSMLVVLMLFNMINSILMFTQSTVEPFFILTYYSNIITAWFDMPDPRFQEFQLGMGPPNPELPTFYSWATPSAEGMIIGVLIYSTLMLVGAYSVYRQKQSKT